MGKVTKNGLEMWCLCAGLIGPLKKPLYLFSNLCYLFWLSRKAQNTDFCPFHHLTFSTLSQYPFVPSTHNPNPRYLLTTLHLPILLSSKSEIQSFPLFPHFPLFPLIPFLHPFISLQPSLLPLSPLYPYLQSSLLTIPLHKSLLFLSSSSSYTSIFSPHFPSFSLFSLIPLLLNPLLLPSLLLTSPLYNCYILPSLFILDPQIWSLKTIFFIKNIHFEEGSPLTSSSYNHYLHWNL